MDDCGIPCRKGYGLPGPVTSLSRNLCFKRSADATSCGQSECGSLSYGLDAAGNAINVVLTDSQGAVVPQPWVEVKCPEQVTISQPIDVNIIPGTPVPGTRPVVGVPLCLADGTAISVYTSEPTKCLSGCDSPDGAVSITGWMNMLTGVYTAGLPPAGTKNCGEIRDIEIINQLCVFDAAGAVVGTVYTEIAYDETGASAPTYTMVGVDSSGTVTRPYVPAPGTTLGQCAPAKTFENPVHWCDNDVCFEGKALYTRNADNTVTLNGVVTLYGTAVTPAGALMEGGCPEPSRLSRSVCANMTNGEIWDVVREVITSPCGEKTSVFWDMDALIPVDVTLDVQSIRHDGSCQCCKDN